MNDFSWYDKLEKPSSYITQGDIIFDCSIYRPIIPDVADDESNEFSNSENRDIEVEKIVFTGIVMTQACDIEQNNVGMVIVCPVKTIYEVGQESGWTMQKAKSHLGSIAKNQMPAYFLLNKYTEGADMLMEYMIVDFKNVFSIPIDVLRMMAKNNAMRLRLKSPYRESLAQAFGRFFMRVGLPASVDKTELNNFIDTLSWT